MFPRAGTAMVLLASVFLGLAAAVLAAIFYSSTSGQAREMRRSMETLLRPRPRIGISRPPATMAAWPAAAFGAAGARHGGDAERESSRLEAKFGGMVEAVVAVDPLLRITFVRSCGTDGRDASDCPGIPLVQVARDHALLDMSRLLAAGEPQQRRLVLAAAAAPVARDSGGAAGGRPKPRRNRNAATTSPIWSAFPTYPEGFCSQRVARVAHAAGGSDRIRRNAAGRRAQRL